MLSSNRDVDMNQIIRERFTTPNSGRAGGKGGPNRYYPHEASQVVSVLDYSEKITHPPFRPASWRQESGELKPIMTQG